MSCFVVNDSCRPIQVTLDRDDDFPLENRYNVILSKDAVDRKRHLEQFMLNPSRRRQLYCLMEPFTLMIENRLGSVVWESGNDPTLGNLLVVKDLQ